MGAPAGGQLVDVSGLFSRDCSQTVAAEFSPVSVDDVKAYLKVSGDAENDLFELWINAAAVETTVATDHQLAEATYVAYFDAFATRLWLPIVPLLLVESVEYQDADGTWNTVDPSLYTVATRGRHFGYVQVADGAAWPTPGRSDRAVRVTFTAGYADAESIPAAARQAVCMLVGHWHMNREAASPERLAEVPLGVDCFWRTLRATW